MHDNDIKERFSLAPIPLTFEHFIRGYHLNFYTDLTNIALFKTVFNHVAAKAHVVTYWEG